MSRRWFGSFLVFSVVILSVMTAGAVDKAAAMQTRVYQMEPDFESVSLERAGKAATLTRSKTPREILIENGIPFPEGAVAVLDRQRWRLTVRNTAENLAVLDVFMEGLAPRLPLVALLTVTVIEGPGAAISGLAADVRKSEALKDFLQAASAQTRDLQVVDTSFASAQSGNRCTIHSAREFAFVDDVELDAKGRSSVVSKLHLQGLSVEIEPTIGPDRETIDANVEIEYTTAQPSTRQERVTEPVTGSPLERQVTSFPNATIKTSVSMKRGESRLLGVLKNGGATEGKESDRMCAVVLTSELMPQKQPRVILPAAMAATLPENADKIQTGTIRIPMDLIPDGFSIPALAKDTAPLSSPGIVMPQGTTFKLVAPGKLMVTSTAEFLDQLEGWTEEMMARIPKSIVLCGKVVEVTNALGRTLIEDAAHETGHTAVVAKLMEVVARGEAREVDAFYLNTKSGQMCHSESGWLRQFVDKISWDDARHVSASTDRRVAGLSVETGATVRDDGSFVTFDLSVKHHAAPLVSRRESLVDPASKRRYEIPRDDFHSAHLQTAVTMKDGGTRIIGAWNPAGRPPLEKEKAMHLLLLTCHVLRHEPRPEPPSAISIKPDDQPAPEFMGQMITRSLRVPPDFLSLGPSEADLKGIPPVDPFAPNPGVAVKKRKSTAEQILKWQGVPFPKGASASYNSVTSTLTVTNTRANVLLIDAFGDVLREKLGSVLTTTHFFQGNGAMLRKLVTDAAGRSDHRAVLDRLLAAVKTGEVTALDTSFLTARSGGSATGENATKTSCFTGTKLDDKDSPVIERETIPVGLRMEIEPTVSSDGATVDLNYAMEFHTAPPMPRNETIAPARDEAQLPAVELPLMDFYRAHSTSAITILSGTARILALWRPKGRDEFELQDIMQIAILEATVE